MKLIDQEGASIMCDLLAIITEEIDEVYTDEMLLAYMGDVYEALLHGVKYLGEAGFEPPLEVLGLLARFIRAAMADEDGPGGE